MAERHRSRDGTRGTDAFLKDAPPTPGGQGETGGDLSRELGARADEKRAMEPDAGATRVRKSDTEAE